MSDFSRAKLAYLAACFDDSRPMSAHSTPSTTSTQYASSSSSQYFTANATASTFDASTLDTTSNSNQAISESNTTADYTPAPITTANYIPAPNTTDYEFFEFAHSTPYARTLRTLEGEDAYQNQMTWDFDRAQRRQLCEDAKALRKQALEARLSKESSKLRRTWKRVKAWLKEAYTAPILL